MLGSHTKQINSYGKRARRVVDATSTSARALSTVEIISIFDDLPAAPEKTSIANKMKKKAALPNKSQKQENEVPKAGSPKVVGLQRKKRLSPILSPIKKKKLSRLAELKASETQQPPHPALVKSKPKPLPSGTVDNPIVVSVPSEQDIPSVSTPRTPLSAVPINLPGSPSLMHSGRSTSNAVPLKGKKKSFVPFVDVDITVFDTHGCAIHTEKRVTKEKSADTGSRLGFGLPHIRRPKAAPASSPATDSESEREDSPVQSRRGVIGKKLVLLSDGSESDDEGYSKPKHIPKKEAKSGASSSQRTISRTNTVLEVVIPPAPYRLKPHTSLPIHIPTDDQESRRPIPQGTQRYQSLPSPPLKPRQLTPIRGGRKRLFVPPSPPSPTTPTDFDLSIDFADLNLSVDAQTQNSYPSDFTIPNFLIPLLQECHQENCGPHNFSTFIETFPYDAIFDPVRDRGVDLQFKKIGEASYSEVFGIGDVVLKVIPLRDESKVPESLSEEEGPPPSDATDVRKEIIVTRAMGEVHDGFVKLMKTYVVRGRYPEVLLRLWDEYDEQKGSESIRPDNFKVSQVYAIIVLPNGGPDLEAYTFHNANRVGWRQACSLFWQVAKALAHAERLVSFEHRDLHWGQILVKSLQANARRSLKSKNGRVWMDDLSHGVQATVIDLGLSRMDAGDETNGNHVHWTPFDEEVFMGEGDYQFDVYRMMRELTGDAWAEFHPFTNVIWLHYLLHKLLHCKGLKPPNAIRKNKAATEMPVSTSEASFSEKDCYDCLVDLESWLGQCIAERIPASSLRTIKTKGRKKVQATAKHSTPIGPACAIEIVAYGAKKEWIKPAKVY
ncbi:hypothetical protein CPC08DRAFT_813270 [Agrocybe pediades]|nr:hypothetical protein CPC08DRAFT_813270 [Agrocybe pediades]